jgi:acyl-CoA synthetase (AMP-forming)/AMP-acid ligase II
MRSTDAADATDVAWDETLRSWCRERLAGYKVPKTFHQLDRLPRSALDKLAKTELRERFDQLAGRGRRAVGGAGPQEDAGVER